jgi:hypothetical protein
MYTVGVRNRVDYLKINGVGQLNHEKIKVGGSCFINYS